MGLSHSLGAKLVAGFLAILVLLLATAGVALWQLHTADRAADATSGIYLPSLRDTGEMATCLNRLRRLEFAISTFADPKQQARYVDDIDATLAEYRKAEQDYLPLPMSPEEEQVYKTVSGSFPAYAAEVAKVRDLAVAGKRAEAIAFIDAGREAYLGIEKALIRITAINNEEAEEAAKEQDRATAHAYLFTSLAAAISLALGLGLALWLTRRIVRPVTAVSAALTGLADGDLTRQVAVASSDEIGTMAATLNRTMTGLRGSVGSITQGAQGVAGAAEELSAVSKQLAGNAGVSAEQSQQSAAAANEVAASIATISSGVEELTASVGEIAKNAGDAAAVAKDGVAAAATADQAMGRLATASAEIGGIVNLITGIAEQTNLLALNATIEAARAGDAGRGFAVVASEVKELARKTGEATGDIGKRIAGIQGESQAAQEALKRIREIVGRINELQQSIASAVEEQSATTRELSGNIGQVAAAGTSIAGNAAAVATAAKEAATGAGEGLKSAQELARLAAELRQAVARFTV